MIKEEQDKNIDDIYEPITGSKLNRKRLARFEIIFWVTFFLFPLFTGALSYHWLPNESYDSGIHQELSSKDCSDLYHKGECVTVWQDIKTGKIYTRDSFIGHQKEEAKRMAVTWFLYGLIGCFFAGYVNSIKKEKFFDKFGIAILVNLIISFYIFITI